MNWRVLGGVFFLVVLLLDLHCKHSTDLPPLPGYDTTSHGFLWQIDTVGEGPSNALFDVVILNDTLAFAVGEVYQRDSTGELDPQPYDFARWNGSNWTLSRITHVGLRAVFAFGPNDIWVGNSSVRHWDGSHWVEHPLSGAFNGSVSRFWGTSSGDLYIVGTNGSIAHWNGGTWQSLASGTTLDIGDVYGARDSGGVEVQILAVAGNPNVSSDRRILQISRLDVTDLSSSGISGTLSGVWLISNTLFYVVGDEIYKKNNLTNAYWTQMTLPPGTPYKNQIRANKANDICVCGRFGEILHYNGADWQSYRSETGLVNGQYRSLAIKGNLVIAVGEDPPHAVVTTGRR